MEAPIPEDWLKPVLRLLNEGKFGREIVFPLRVQNEWESQTLGAFIWEVRDPLIVALSALGVMGLHIPNQPEPGNTYAFWFHFNNRKFYGKICLYPDHLKLKLLSAHLPNRGQSQL